MSVTTGPYRQPPVTRVQFPRFQHEVIGTADRWPYDCLPPNIVAESPDEWLDPQMLDLIARPRDVTDRRERNEKKRLNWFGEYHHVVEDRTPPLRLLDGIGQAGLYDMTVARHNYCWDHQAMPGSAMEAVLRRFEPGVGYVDEAALLFRDPRSHEQTLVIAHPDRPGFHAPKPTERDIAESALFKMVRLAR